MIKKTVKSLIAVSAVCAGLGLGVSAASASAWNNSSISVDQTRSGWSSFTQFQKSNQSQSEVSTGDAVGQTSVISGAQTQAGTSNGSATASQSQDRSVDVGDELNGNTQTTEASGTTEQTTTTEGPAKLVQKQTTVNATFHYQGKLIQKQANQNHEYQFSTAISK
jgi:hypothetical protein